ncbi:MAG: putative Ig domain-containing protein, partial [Myxococcota bacterium]|nr:putative Ig domain-containing protein [Myxococcota bacterium]
APEISVKVTAVYDYTPEVTDEDGHVLNFELVLGPESMAVDASTGALQWAPGDDDVGSHEIALVASDGRGGSALQRFTLGVLPGGFNSPPVFTSAPVTSIPVGAAYTYEAQAVDADADALLFSLVEAPDGLTVDPDSGHVAWPVATQGAHKVVLAVEDPALARSTQTWILVAGELADFAVAPVITSTPPVTAQADELYLYQVQAHAPDLAPLDYSLFVSPEGMGLDADTGRITWIPTTEQEGVHPVTVLVSDGLLGEATQSFAVTVAPFQDNQPPAFVTSPPLEAVVGTTYSYLALAEDPEEGQVLYSLVTGPPGLSIDPSSGQVTWEPLAEDAGSHPVKLRATDPELAKANQVFVLELRESNVAPTITSTPGLLGLVGQAYLYDVEAEDADGDLLVYALDDAPDGMTIIDGTGLVTFYPATAEVGIHQVSVSVRDCCGGLATQTWALEVIADTTAPTVVVQPSRNPACLQFQESACVQASDDVGVVERELLVGAQSLVLDEEGCTLLPQFESEGPVQLVGTARDASQNEAVDEVTLVLSDCVDEEDPVVEIIAPAPGSAVTGLVDLVYTVTDNNPEFLTWTLRYGLLGSDELTLLAEGSGETFEEALGTLDTTLLAQGDYLIEILAADGLRSAGFAYTLTVDGALKLGNFQISVVDLSATIAGFP